MANLKGCFSHKSDDWKTPSWIYKTFMDENYIDPCPYQADFDGLKVNYYGVRLFVNPPYSNISEWVDWLIKQWKNNLCDFALLVPARTDTKWFHKLLNLGIHIYFFKGRLHFDDSKDAAPFPSVLITNFEEEDLWKELSSL